MPRRTPLVLAKEMASLDVPTPPIHMGGPLDAAAVAAYAPLAYTALFRSPTDASPAMNFFGSWTRQRR